MSGPVRGSIDRVTVFKNGALVERVATVPPGEVEMVGLPLLIAADTLRVRASDAEVRDVEESAALEAAAAGGEPPEDALEALELDLESLERARARIADAERALQAVAPTLPAEDPPSPLPRAELWLSAHATLAAKLESLALEREELDRQIVEKRDELRRRATEGREDPAPPRYSRAVRFRVQAEAPVEVRVEYFVPAARWVPSYALHLEGGRAHLTLAALVAQASGEDWSGAALRFSTADLSRATTLPELLSWRIGRRQPPRAPRFRPLPNDLDELFSGYDLGARRPRPATTPTPPPPAPDGFEFEDSTGIDEEESVSGADLQPVVSALSEIDDAFFDDADDRSFANAAPPAEQAPLPSPPPPPSAAPAPARKAAPPRGELARRSKKLRSDAAFGGGGAAAHVSPEPPEPLPPKLRYAYLRLRGPDEAQRGQLIPVSPLEHLYQLVEGHDAAHESDLRRAVQALQRAAERLGDSPLPTGAISLQQCHFHHVYDAPGAHEIPTDGVYHRLEVHQFDTSANIEFRAVPREAPEVYRYCVLDAPVGVPLPAGPLHVYEDGAFQVTSRLDPDGGGRALELNLGVEDALRLDGRVVNVRQSEKGVITSRSAVEHAVTVRYRSGLEQPARLIVFDRLPVVEEGEKDLAVELVEAEPPPQRTDKSPAGETLRGGLRWVLDLPPGGERALSYRYHLELPAKSEVVGGNRRE